jgi:NAD(P)-dependent dehydrogenase (short-subunit alcohol dehydrogenase family)
MKRFENKVVLVTGGNVGIGLATARAFAREGARVVISARRETEGVEAVKRIQAEGGVSSFFRGDVASEADVAATVAHAVSKFGHLDVVFNNAGVEGTVGPIATLSAADFDETFSVNVRGSWLVIKHAAPHLAATRGAIVNNASVAADVGVAGTTIYAPSKGAIVSLTRTAAIELIASGVRVNAVSPGPIETDMGQRFFGSLDNMRSFAKTRVPSGVSGTPEDIAQAVLFLASAEARYIVGQTLTVDGGMTSQ